VSALRSTPVQAPLQHIEDIATSTERLLAADAGSVDPAEEVARLYGHLERPDLPEPEPWG
jgi:hypothetical protein